MNNTKQLNENLQQTGEEQLSSNTASVFANELQKESASLAAATGIGEVMWKGKLAISNSAAGYIPLLTDYDYITVIVDVEGSNTTRSYTANFIRDGITAHGKLTHIYDPYAEGECYIGIRTQNTVALAVLAQFPNRTVYLREVIAFKYPFN